MSDSDLGFCPQSSAYLLNTQHCTRSLTLPSKLRCFLPFQLKTENPTLEPMASLPPLVLRSYREQITNNPFQLFTLHFSLFTAFQF